MSPAYNVRLPTGEHHCVGDGGVAALLRKYRAKRPDDPYLSHVWVYELAASGAVAGGPVALERFIPELAQSRRQPA